MRVKVYQAGYHVQRDHPERHLVAREVGNVMEKMNLHALPDPRGPEYVDFKVNYGGRIVKVVAKKLGHCADGKLGIAIVTAY